MKSHILINFRVIFLGLIYVALLIFSGILVIYDLSFFAVFSFIGLLALVVGWFLISPYYMRITDQDVTIYYAFGKKVFARWEDIREIQKHSYKFLIDYKFLPMRGWDNFHNGSFPKSRKLRKLIEEYWSGAIH